MEGRRRNGQRASISRPWGGRGHVGCTSTPFWHSRRGQIQWASRSDRQRGYPSAVLLDPRRFPTIRANSSGYSLSGFFSPGPPWHPPRFISQSRAAAVRVVTALRPRRPSHFHFTVMRRARQSAPNSPSSVNTENTRRSRLFYGCRHDQEAIAFDSAVGSPGSLATSRFHSATAPRHSTRAGKESASPAFSFIVPSAALEPEAMRASARSTHQRRRPQIFECYTSTKWRGFPRQTKYWLLYISAHRRLSAGLPPHRKDRPIDLRAISTRSYFH